MTMTNTPAPPVTTAKKHPLGSAGFAFEPSPGTVSGAAFSPLFKVLGVAIVSGCAWWLYTLWSSGRLSTGAGGGTGLGWVLAGLGMMGLFAWFILRSQVTLSREALTQTWVWDKRTDLRDLVYAKLMRVRGLDWLIAPRLYVRTIDAKFFVYYASDPVVIAQMERLATELRSHVTPK